MDFYDALLAGLFMTYVEIISPAKTPGHVWDIENPQVLRFHNFKKLLYFAEYYTKSHDVLIKIYTKIESHNVWYATYCKGKEICNCW